MTGAHIRNRKPATWAIPKIHFASGAIIFCVVKRGFHPHERTEDWAHVTCRNCKAGKSSKEWREHVGAKLT